MSKILTSASTKTTAPNQIVKRFNEVIKRREAWELGAYKASNDQLYEILASAYELYLHLVKSVTSDDRKTFTNLLKSKKVAFQSNTPLHTKVVRLVFAASRQRAYTYGRVLLAARKENLSPSALPDWIRDCGGVEEVKVKSSGKLTQAEKAKADGDYASDTLAKAKPIINVGKVPDMLKPNAEHNPVYSLALVRCDNGKDAEIVWGTNNAAAIAKVLALAGKTLRTVAETKAVKNIKRAAAKNARSAIANAASTAIRKVKTTSSSEKLAA
jgi:hypothetical protein